MLSLFHHWEKCLLWVCHIWLLLCWSISFYAYFLESFYHKWMLNFVKSFLCIYWDDHLIFIFQFVNMVYHIYWLMYIQESLQPWNKPHLIMVYDPFNVLLDSVCCNFFEDFCIYIHQWYWPVIFFFCGIFVSFWYQGDSGLIEWVWEYSSFCNFLEKFE